MNSVVLETATLIALIVRAVVSKTEDVSVTPTPSDDSKVIFKVRVSPADLDKVVGAKGKVSRSVMSIVQAVAQKQKLNFGVELTDAAR